MYGNEYPKICKSDFCLAFSFGNVHERLIGSSRCEFRAKRDLAVSLFFALTVVLIVIFAVLAGAGEFRFVRFNGSTVLSYS